MQVGVGRNHEGGQPVMLELVPDIQGEAAGQMHKCGVEGQETLGQEKFGSQYCV